MQYVYTYLNGQLQTQQGRSYMFFLYFCCVEKKRI